MNPRSAASNSFVPLEPASDGSKSPPAPGNVRVAPEPVPGPVFTPLTAQSAAHTHRPGAGKPVVTLEREGDQVSLIRIECSCGQVIELACSYANNPLAP